MNKYISFVLFFLFILFSFRALSFPSSSYLIANTAVKLYDYEEANRYFSNEDIKNLNDADFNDNLFTLVNLHFFNEAYDLAKLILKKYPSNQEAWLVYLSKAKLENKKQPFAEYTKSQNSEGFDLIKHIFYAGQKIKKDNIAISRSIFEIVQSTVSNDYQEQKNYNYLLFYLSISILFNPSFDEAYYYSGYIYQILKKYEKAELNYSKVSNNHALFFESQKNIAINKSELGLFDEAESDLLNLIRINKKNENLLITLADIYRIEKKYDEAIHYYSEILELNKYKAQYKWRLLYYRGVCFERLNNWKMAEKNFLESLEIKPNSPQVLNYLAYGWIEQNVFLDRSLKMLESAYTSDPDSHYILDSLAWAYFKKNDLIKAINLMEKVISMAPGEAISLDHLGDIYFAVGRKREAIYMWKQAKDLAEPEDMISEALDAKLEKYYAG